MNDNATVTEDIQADIRPIVVKNGKEYRVNLSDEHAAAIVYDGIYKADPNDFRDFEWISKYWNTSGQFHCRNWCFTVSVNVDGKVSFVDTYWSTLSSDDRFYITDDNFDKMFPRFQLIMDNKDNYHSVNSSDVQNYDPNDIVKAAFDSSGWTYGKTNWVRNGTSRSARLELRSSLNEARRALNNATNSYDLGFALRGLENDINKVLEQYEELDDTIEMRERDDFFATLNASEMLLGDAACGDFKKWLAEDAYCPGEIYTRDGFSCCIFGAEDMAYKFHECVDENMYEFFLVPSNDSIVIVSSEKNDDGTVKAQDAICFDATKNNLKVCLAQSDDNFKLDNLDEYARWHNNGEAPKIVAKLEVAIKAIDELKETLAAM